MKTNYTQYVREHEACLKGSGLLKAAQDLASLLDDPELLRSQRRKEAFIRFCEAVACSGGPRPPMDIDCVIGDLPESPRQQDAEFSSAVTQAVPEDDAFAAAIVKLLGCYRNRDQRSLSTDNILAILNRHLIDHGHDPIPFDISETCKTAVHRAPPQQTARVVIIDDEPNMIISSALPLVGWPNVEILFYLYKSGIDEARLGKNGPTEEQRKFELERVANEVVSMDPTLVLMDQGLGRGIHGSELMPVIGQKNPMISFVANSGGGGFELTAVGALPNFDKGRSLTGVLQAFGTYSEEEECA